MPEDALVTTNNEKAAWAPVQTQPLDFAAGQQFAYNQTLNPFPWVKMPPS